jgi:formylmethanofuran dehydrogenase subunit A
VEKDLSDYFNKYQTMQLANFKINPDEIADDGRGSIVVHSGKHSDETA